VFSFNSVANASCMYLEEWIVLTRKPQSFHVLVNVTCTPWGEGKIGYGRWRWTTGCLHHDVHCRYWKRRRNSRNCPIPTCWHRCWNIKSKSELQYERCSISKVPYIIKITWEVITTLNVTRCVVVDSMSATIFNTTSSNLGVQTVLTCPHSCFLTLNKPLSLRRRFMGANMLLCGCCQWMKHWNKHWDILTLPSAVLDARSMSIILCHVYASIALLK
jgi:hypothetical protein